MGKLNRSFQLGGPTLLDRHDREPQPDPRSTTTCRSTSRASRAWSTSSAASRSACPRPPRRRTRGIDLPAGRPVVKGDQALAFVRQRKKLPNGDLDRIARQQQFLGAMVRKVLSAGTLLNPLRLNGFLDVATELAAGRRGPRGRATCATSPCASAASPPAASASPPSRSPASTARSKNADGLFESVVLLDEAKGDALFQTHPRRRPARRARARRRRHARPGAGRRARRASGSRCSTAPASPGSAGGPPPTCARSASPSSAPRATAAPARRGPSCCTGRTGPTRAAHPGGRRPRRRRPARPDAGRTLQLVVGSDYSGAQRGHRRRRPAAPTAPAASATPAGADGRRRTRARSDRPDRRAGRRARPRRAAAHAVRRPPGAGRAVRRDHGELGGEVGQPARRRRSAPPSGSGLLLPLHWQTVALLLAAVATGGHRVVGAAPTAATPPSSRADRLGRGRRRRRGARAVGPPARRARAGRCPRWCRTTPARCRATATTSAARGPRAARVEPAAPRCPRPDRRRPAAHRAAARGPRAGWPRCSARCAAGAGLVLAVGDRSTWPRSPPPSGSRRRPAPTCPGCPAWPERADCGRGPRRKRCGARGRLPRPGQHDRPVTDCPRRPGSRRPRPGAPPPCPDRPRADAAPPRRSCCCSPSLAAAAPGCTSSSAADASRPPASSDLRVDGRDRTYLLEPGHRPRRGREGGRRRRPAPGGRHAGGRRQGDRARLARGPGRDARLPGRRRHLLGRRRLLRPAEPPGRRRRRVPRRGARRRREARPRSTPQRTALVGYSSGGMLTYRYVCARPGTLAAAVVVSGSLESPCAQRRQRPRRPHPARQEGRHHRARAVLVHQGPRRCRPKPVSKTLRELTASAGCGAPVTSTEPGADGLPLERLPRRRGRRGQAHPGRRPRLGRPRRVRSAPPTSCAASCSRADRPAPERR